MNGVEIDGCKLFVGPAQKKAERRKALEERYEKRRREQQENTRGRNLYVKHLMPSMEDDGLKDLFAKFGTVTSCKVARSSLLTRLRWMV